MTTSVNPSDSGMHIVRLTVYMHVQQDIMCLYNYVISLVYYNIVKVSMHKRFLKRDLADVGMAQ